MACLVILRVNKCEMEVKSTSNRKRVSKKTKKAWRKHSDIRDIENYLDDVRLQERTGGIVAERTNSELFFVDKNTAVSDAVPSEESTNKRRRVKPLRCHAVLLSAPGIQPARACHATAHNHRVTARKNRRQTKSSEAASYNTQKSAKPSRVTEYDLWSQNDTLSSGANGDEHFLTTCRIKRVKPPNHYHNKPSELPAIAAPHPGTSYQPAAFDHKDLVQKAAEVERKRLREEQRIKRALDAKFPSAKDAPDEMTWLREWAGDDDDVSDEGDDTPASVSHNPPVRRENKKTERERKRLKSIKAEERELAKLKMEKIRQSSVLRLKSAKKEVTRHEMKLAARAARRQRQKQLTDGVRTRKLGRVKYEEPSVDLKLSSEQVNCLRQLTPEGSLLRDQFVGLQKRNMIEPRKRAKATRRYKPKAFEKKAHKSVTE